MSICVLCSYITSNTKDLEGLGKGVHSLLWLMDEFDHQQIIKLACMHSSYDRCTIPKVKIIFPVMMQFRIGCSLNHEFWVDR